MKKTLARMGRRGGCLGLCLLFAATVAAQTNAIAYFGRSLAVDSVLELRPSQKIGLKQIEPTRRALWQDWCAAVKKHDGSHLATVQSLAAAVPDSLVLPDSLERGTMPYYWGSKSVEDNEVHVSDTLPTLIYLHGSGPKAQEWAASLKWAQVFSDAPSRYFIPQIPDEGEYYRWWQRGKQWAYAWLWRQLTAVAGVDANRVSLFGISEGGYGSQRLASFYADYLASAGPMAGGEPLMNAPVENLGHVSFSLLTGEEDRAFCRNLFTRITGEALDSMRRLYPQEYQHRVELISGMGHGFDYRPTTPWLIRFHRQPNPRHFLWEDFDMDGCHRKGFYNLRITRRPGDAGRISYEVSIGQHNRVEVKVNNVEYTPIEKETVSGWGLTLRWRKEYRPSQGGSFVLYLDENMVDLKKSVTVVVNGREVYRGKLRPSRETMMESLSVYADPMRIYPTSVSVEY